MITTQEQLQEHLDHEFLSQEYMTWVYEAGFGEDSDAYEDSWVRTLNYYEKQGY